MLYFKVVAQCDINEVVFKEAKLQELNNKVKTIENSQEKHLSLMDFNTELTTKVSGKKNGFIDKLQSALWVSNKSSAEKEAMLQEVTEKFRRLDVDMQDAKEEICEKKNRGVLF